MDDKASAESFLKKAADAYASEVGVSLPSGMSNAPIMSPMMGDAGLMSGNDNELRDQITTLANDIIGAFGELSLCPDTKTKVKETRDIKEDLVVLRNEVKELQGRVKEFELELGSEFLNGVIGKFDIKKCRTYKSSWSWIQQDAFKLLQVIKQSEIDGHKSLGLMLNDLDYKIRIKNRLNVRASRLLMNAYDFSMIQKEEFGKELLINITKPAESGSGTIPLCDLMEICRPDIKFNINGPMFIQAYETVRNGNQFGDEVFIRRNNTIDKEATACYKSALNKVWTEGLNLKGKTILVTGSGEGSIGLEFVSLCLSAGAFVICTTSREPNRSNVQTYRNTYEKWAVDGAELRLVPFNGASRNDVNAIVDYIYQDLGRDIDVVVPFAALPQKGKDITNIDSRCELAYRLMAMNIERLLGRIVLRKRGLQAAVKSSEIIFPTIAILPCSPNHGTFGLDGSYGASKIALEVLGNKSISEGWSDVVTVVNSVIGWTRGTGLMSHFDAVSALIEVPESETCSPIRTFSSREMAAYLMTCLSPDMLSFSYDGPYFADLSGGLDLSPSEISEVFGRSYQTLSRWNQELKDIVKIFSEPIALDYFNKLYFQRMKSHYNSRVKSIESPPCLKDAIPLMKGKDTLRVLRGCRYEFKMPRSEYNRTDTDQILFEMTDLRKVPVVVGFAEYGPFVNANARWEKEAYNYMSNDTILEICLYLGYIKPAETDKERNNNYWLLTETNEPLNEIDVRKIFEDKLLKKTGIRLLTIDDFPDKKAVASGYDGRIVPYFQSAIFERDSPEFTVASVEDAMKFKDRQPDKVFIDEKEDGTASVRILSGATCLIPAQSIQGFALAALAPSDFDWDRNGIPKELSTIDANSKSVVWATADAMLSAGLIDSLELFQNIHVSEVGNAIGGGFGGISSIRSVFNDRILVNQKAKVGSDTFAEVFINSASAWVNMLLFGANGPIRPAVGACGTALLSVENAIDSIIKGDARVMVAGAGDQFERTSAYEFCMMGASVTSAAEDLLGRDPSEASRPTSSSRGGFLESGGAGILVITDAELALEMGLPIKAILAHTLSAMDGISRSVPAPGKGILTTCSEARKRPNMLEDINYRYGLFTKARSDILNRYNDEVDSVMNKCDEFDVTEVMNDLDEIYDAELRSLQNRYGNDAGGSSDSLSKLRKALMKWNLTVDDITVASFHGTSTTANDLNESETIQTQMNYLGRTSGNQLHVVCQKSLTGHPKGPAAAWMMNGAMQMMEENIIPGNFNLDDVDERLKQFDHLLYRNCSTKIMPDEDGIGVKSVLLKSFGFGQVGGESLLLNPIYLYKILPSSNLKKYKEKLSDRNRSALKFRREVLHGIRSLLQIKERPYAEKKALNEIILNKRSRHLSGTLSTFKDGVRTTKGSIRSAKSLSHSISGLLNNQDSTLLFKSSSITSGGMITLGSQVSSPTPVASLGVGFDLTTVKTVYENNNWVEYNFTDEERKYCESRPNSSRAFWGRWAAKEAAFKALGNAGPSSPRSFLDASDSGDSTAHKPMRDIEILTGYEGNTEVKLHGEALHMAKVAGVNKIHVSISYDGDKAAAVAQAI